MATNQYSNITELIKDYINMPVTDYLDVSVTINEVTLLCDIYRVDSETSLDSTIFTGCVANDANTQIIIGKDMTVESGTTLIPPYRCKGLFIGDIGTFTNNGIISMTARGASGEGKNIQLTTNYLISAVGGSANSSPASGVLSCAGGGNGGNFPSSGYMSASGGTGTSFSGGSGGGGTGASKNPIGGVGSSTGGAGGNGYCTGDANASGGGGAGNPGGAPATHGSGTATAGSDGTGGLCVIIGTRIVSTGSFNADGSTGGNASASSGSFGGSGGGSGAGCIVLLANNFDVTGTHSVTGGQAGTSNGASGQAGGDGVYASYIVSELDFVDLSIEFALTNSDYLDNIEPSEKVRFIALLDEDKFYYDALGQRHQVNGGGSGGGGHTITDGTTEFTQRDNLQFNEPFTVEDNAIDGATEVSVDVSGELDMTAFTPPSQLSPGVNQIGMLDDVEITTPADGQGLTYDATQQKWVNGAGGMHEYSTTEKVVGTWIDGRPIYEKMFLDVIHIVNTTAHLEQSLGLSNIDFAFLDMAFARQKDGSGNITILFSLPSAYGATYLYMPNIAVVNNDINCCFDRQNTGWSEGQTYICYNIRYIKTTDSPTQT